MKMYTNEELIQIYDNKIKEDTEIIHEYVENM